MTIDPSQLAACEDARLRVASTGLTVGRITSGNARERCFTTDLVMTNSHHFWGRPVTNVTKVEAKRWSCHGSLQY